MHLLAAHRFTVEEYHRMAETGVLKPDAQVELVRGQIVDMSPIGPYHGGVTKRLIRLFTRLSENRWLVSAQDPVRLDAHSEPQPDLMLLRPAPDDYTSRHPTPADVFLLVEVADSTVPYDRGEKLAAYGGAGVPEVWLINLPERAFEIHRDPHYTGYSSITIVREGEVASPRAFPDVEIDVASVLKQAK
jgi:Uma2 family endonuclease